MKVMLKNPVYKGYVGKTVFKYSVATFDTLLAKSETNDCVVRSIAAATGENYDRAHKYCNTKFHRKNRMGTQIHKLRIGGIKAILNHSIKIMSATKKVKRQGLKNAYRVEDMKVKDVIKAYPKGKYLVVISRHMFALVDGVILGNYEDGKSLNKRVFNVFKLTPKS